MAVSKCIAILSLVLLHLSVILCQEKDEAEAAVYLAELDLEYSYECNLEMEARWSYITDVTNTTLEEEANAASVRYLSFQGEAAVNVSALGYESFSNIDLYRQSRFQADQGPGGLPHDDLVMYKDLQSSMETTYSTATICIYEEMNEPNCTMMELEPDIEDVMATSTDWDELTYVWEEWREVTGKSMREDFINFVNLSNQAAVLDGYGDTGDYWLNGYTVTVKEATAYQPPSGGQLTEISQDEFQMMAETVWNQVSTELYKKLHAFVRMKMKDRYPEHISSAGLLPANVLGNMWAQDWTNIAEYVMPFSDQPDFDVTDSMIANGWDIDQMFESAEDFFTSIGLFKMTDIFWEKSVINQTDWGKSMVCHASAEDFCLGPDSTDFRIKMCTQVNMNDLTTVHHEMGHIEYFMAYTDLPHVYRTSANPGFHEAIGDLIALSVSTPQHLEDVLHLTPTKRSREVRASDYTVDEQRDLNFLMRMALEKIAFLPFGFLIDKYRWAVYDGSISSDDLNAGWWNLRETLQGVTPPIGDRGEEYFDPGAKYHVPANVPYIRYFVSYIVQFQFHKHLCLIANHQGPLYTCDIYNNTAAGDVLAKSLEDGFSKPWPLVLKDLGGSMEMDASAIIEYFQPLIDYFDEVLVDECIGWGEECQPPETQIEEELLAMDTNLTDYVISYTEASWAYYTDSTAANGAASSEAAEELSSMYNYWWQLVIKDVDSSLIEDSYTRRQVELQKSIGTAILDPNDFKTLTNLVNDMTDAFNNKICPYDDLKCDEDSDGLTIDELEEKMADMTLEYAEHHYYWTEWRKVSGREVLESYPQYVVLENKAARANDFYDAGEMWLNPYTSSDYTTEDFKSEIDKLLDDVSVFYRDLHAYVRYKLKQDDRYEDHIGDDGLIPAHILGNMWAQSWENIYDLVKPTPAELIDLSNSLASKISDSEQMYKIAEDFFTSMGMYEMTPDFWNNSMFDQPPDKTVVCHASAWDFSSTQWKDGVNPRDEGRFRIKMCTDHNQGDFITIHHEMGHTQYQMAYSIAENEADLRMPLIFRGGANPGFHEAIGDTIALSVSTPDHLNMIADYLDNLPLSEARDFMLSRTTRNRVETDEKFSRNSFPRAETSDQDLNFLMKQALAKVPFLQFAYILDEWRWEVFNETITPSLYNRKWWEKRIDFQGICPPTMRDEADDFDIGSKYHVPTSVPYIRYFVAHVLQFQFYKKMCEKASYDTALPIYNCDFYNSAEAGTHLLKMLKKGVSEPWQIQLENFLEVDVGTGNMSILPLLEYFAPLRSYLTTFISEHNLRSGWDSNYDDYIAETEDVSAIVPIVVGSVLALMVLIVVCAYIVGQRRSRSKLKKEMLDMGNTNYGAENKDT